MQLKAVIFDVDGTLAETEEAHRLAFNRAFADAGHDWTWSVEVYRKLLKITGGRERLRHFLDSTGVIVADAEVASIHQRKNELYANLVKDGAVALRPGVARLIAEAREANIAIALATTTSRSNLTALLVRHFGVDSLAWFAAVVAGEDVVRKKPHPEVYVRTLYALDLPADACIAIEDSRNGLASARASDIAVLVTPSLYTSRERFDGAAMIRASLDDPAPIALLDLERLCALSGWSRNHGGNRWT